MQYSYTMKNLVHCFSKPCRLSWNKQFCVFVPDFRHHEAMLDHECVTDGCHHGEDLLAGRIPPDQVQQGVSLMLRVQLVHTLLCDQLHWDSAVILIREGNTHWLEDWGDKKVVVHMLRCAKLRWAACPLPEISVLITWVFCNGYLSWLRKFKCNIHTSDLEFFFPDSESNIKTRKDIHI